MVDEEKKNLIKKRKKRKLKGRDRESFTIKKIQIFPLTQRIFKYFKKTLHKFVISRELLFISWIVECNTNPNTNRQRMNLEKKTNESIFIFTKKKFN